MGDYISNNQQFIKKEKRMKNLVSTNENKKIAGIKRAAHRFLEKYTMLFTFVLLMLVMANGTVFATSADVMWTTVTGEVVKWIQRLGGLLCFYGGIMLGIGQRSDDAERKTQGVNSLIAGGVVIAICGLAGTFF